MLKASKVIKYGFCMAGCTLLSVSLSHGQDIIDMMNQDQVNLKEVQDEAKDYFSKVGTGKGSGYKLFKRWEYHAMTRLQEDGAVLSRAAIANELEKTLQTNKAAAADLSNWTELGPLSWSNTSGYNPGVGRITAIAVEPSSQQIIYAGSPGGGLWKSTNAGSSWSPLGDQFANMEIWAIAIDPNNTNTVYIGNSTGDLYKSTNAGASFSILMNQSSGRVTDILINPNNSSEIFAALRYNGLFKTTNGGSNWTEVITSNIEDVEYKPGSTTTVYACGDNFYRSTNSGSSFTQVSSGIQASERMKLAVSPANSNYVYIVQKKGGGFGYLYRSTNSGVSFTTQSDHTGTNYIGSQGSRDMAIAVSNTNINEVHIGGFNMYKSTNGGTSFTKECDWYYPNTTSGTYEYVHADIEVMQYIDGRLYVGSDGGIFRSTNAGADFTDISTGMGVHQFYRISSSAADKDIVVGGAQDNGTNTMYGTGHNWRHWIGADGMDCATHPTNSNIMFGCYQFGGMRKSTNGGVSLASMVSPPENGSGNWVTPIAIDPNNGNRVYAGYSDLYRHDNSASSGSWVNTSSSFSFSGKLSHIEMCPSNSDVIYVAASSRIYKSSNITSASPSWTQLTGTSGTINDIAVDPYNENRVVVVTSYGYVYESTNGGSSWTRIDSGLPSGSKKTAVLDRSSNKGIYVGLDGVVYFRNNTTSGWELFSNNLPKVDVTELDLYYSSTSGESRVRVATYGRGLWETAMYDDAQNGGGSGSGLTCSNTVSSYPYNESFESSFGNWTQNSDDDFDWSRHSGATGSSGTGPTGADDGTYYIYTEVSSPNYGSKRAILTSPCFDLNGVSNPEFNFRYHMLGSAVGSVDIEVSEDGTTWTSLWTRSGTQGSNWIDGTVSLNAYAGSKIKLRFNVLSGSSYQGDICFDKLNISGGTSTISCTSTISSFPYNESFESGTGAWSDATDDDFNWTRQSGTTLSTGTGPTGASDGTYYMYVETSSPNYPTKKAVLNSSCFNFSSVSNPNMTFKYHMIGSSVGTLKLEASADGVNWTTVWSRTGAQGTNWNDASVDLSAYGGQTIKLRFDGTSSTSWQGDMCIDKLNISNVAPSAAQPECYKLTIALDNYPEETSWEITKNGTVIQAGGPYSVAERGATLVENICLPNGCYEFKIKDQYGDGLCCTRGKGSFVLEDQDGAVLLTGGEFLSSQTYEVCTNGSSELTSTNDDLQLVNDKVLVFPNPVVSTVHVQLAAKGEEVEVKIVDLTGRIVKAQVFDSHEGMNLLKVRTDDIATGAYLINILRGKTQITKKIVIQN